MRFLKIDPFLLGLLASVLLATLVPCHGAAVPVFHWLSVGLIALMFFLQGARLSRKAVLDGMVAWKLHLLILSCTFVLFPLLGLAAHALFPGLLQPDIWMGVLFLCCLPSTVQSSIAFTSIAGGNVPAAVCAATASNVFGIFMTPVLVGLVLSQHGQTTGNPLDIVYQLLLPFILGQVLQPWLGAWAHRNKKILSFSDRGSVLVVVYAAFSDAVMQGLWHRLPMAELGMIAIADSVLLFSVLGLTIFGGRLIGLPLKDEIAVVFCGSKKTLASGVPMANVLFPPASVGVIVLPLMLYHQIQLFVCAVLARRFARLSQEHDHASTTPAQQSG
ncbi:bile acid:sodium symporter family protein [Acetobacter sp.]|uniref:bile acid:sodium symporter family protein n=1 Tax=Acetobacter sp. TaxID=440 RepID=UPI0039ECFA4A